MKTREFSLCGRIFRVIQLKRACLLLVLSIVIIFVIICQRKSKNQYFNGNSQDIPIILWWTPFTGIGKEIKYCSKGSCLFTEDRNYFKNSVKPKVILFYGSDFKIEDLPLPRTNEWWGLLHEESPKNQPLFDHLDVLRLFNITSTFKSNSGVPLTLQYLQGVETLTSHAYYKLKSSKDQYQKELGLASVIYLQSDCNPPSERDEYVEQLAKYIPIDSYGTCLKNKLLPTTLQGIDSMNNEEVLNLISKYKFSLALENSACEDYITEKLWRPLSVGSVPIYWGSPTVEKWLPNERSIVNVRNYFTPRDLGTYLIQASEDNALYEAHLEHKTFGKISNRELVNELNRREWGINEDQETKSTFVEIFECYACDTVIANGDSPQGTFMASLKDYGCPPPETVLPYAKKENSFWLEQWFKAKVEAEVLSDFILKSPGTFTLELFYDKVITILRELKHFEKFYSKEEL